MNECCKKPENLEPLAERLEDDKPPDLVIKKCKVCGRRHYELVLDPGRLAMELRR
jgi:hypothetical protein